MNDATTIIIALGLLALSVAFIWSQWYRGE